MLTSCWWDVGDPSSPQDHPRCVRTSCACKPCNHPLSLALRRHHRDPLHSQQHQRHCRGVSHGHHGAGGGGLSVAGSSHQGAHGDTPEMFFWGVTQQQRPKWGSGLVSLLRGPSHSGQGAAGAQRQPLRGEANSPAPLPLPPAPPCQPGVPWCPRRCCSPCWLWLALPGSSTPCGGGGKVRAPKGATAPIPGTAGPIWGAEWGRSWGGLCVVLWVVLWVVLLCHDFSSCPQTSRDPWER